MKRAIVLLVISILFSACTQDIIEIEESFIPLAETPQNSVYQAALLLDENSGDVLIQAAQRYVKEVSRLSGGEIEIEIIITPNAVESYMSGEGDLTFVSGAQQELNLSGFNAANTSFLYTNYERFTMAVNAKRVKDLVQEGFSTQCSTIIFGAYYEPSKHFLSTWQPTSLEGFNQAQLVMEPDSSSSEGFLLLGAQLIEEDGVNERLLLLSQGYAQGAEFTLEELVQVDWDWGADVEHDYYLTMSYHTAKPVWLIGSDDFCRQISKQHQAALEEASAFLYPLIDSIYMDRETECLEKLLEKGVLVNPSDFSNVQEEILRKQQIAVDSEELETDVLQAYLWNLVEELD